VEPDEQGEAAPQSEEVAKDEAGADAHQPPESALPAPEEAALTVFAVPDAQPAAAGEPERVSAPQPAGASSSKAS